VHVSAYKHVLALMRADTAGFRTDTVRRLLRRQPRTFADWCARNADPPVLLVLDHVVVHLVVAEVGVVHLHHEGVPRARDHPGGRRPAQALRAVEVRVPGRVGEDPEDVPRGGGDPPGQCHGLVFIVRHEVRFLSWQPLLGSGRLASGWARLPTGPGLTRCTCPRTWRKGLAC
jgi:hypothetical protein